MALGCDSPSLCAAVSINSRSDENGVGPLRHRVDPKKLRIEASFDGHGDQRGLSVLLLEPFALLDRHVCPNHRNRTIFGILMTSNPARSIPHFGTAQTRRFCAG